MYESNKTRDVPEFEWPCKLNKRGYALRCRICVVVSKQRGVKALICFLGGCGAVHKSGYGFILSHLISKHLFVDKAISYPALYKF
jgi:hypothetical protein